MSLRHSDAFLRILLSFSLDPILPKIAFTTQTLSETTTQLNILLEHRPQTGISRSKERDYVRARLAELEKKIDEYKKETIELQTRINDLSSHVHYRRKQIEMHRTHSLAIHSERTRSHHETEMGSLGAKYAESCEVLGQSRKVLVRELCGVFGLRRSRKDGHTHGTGAATGTVTGSLDDHLAAGNTSPPSSGSLPIHIANGGAGDTHLANGSHTRSPSDHPTSPTNGGTGSPNHSPPLTSASPPARAGKPSDRSLKDQKDDIVIVNVSFPTNGDFWNYNRDEFNTGVGYIAHMTKLVAYYLEVALPFEMELQGSKSFARANYHETMDAKKTPLFLQPDNADEFLVGFAMLCFNIAYLCHTQGVKVGHSNVRAALKNLYMCCHAPSLGSRDLDTPIPLRTDISFHSTLDSSFPLDFSRVVKELRELKASSAGSLKVSGAVDREHHRMETQEDFEIIDWDGRADKAGLPPRVRRMQSLGNGVGTKRGGAGVGEANAIAMNGDKGKELRQGDKGKIDVEREWQLL
ncbi:hypothetical protein HDU93_003309 [Gonapodya sp. JEL0774]|nr:hypothetical protein HDU93_003309 [Gonapodya sp. JEL0774]